MIGFAAKYGSTSLEEGRRATTSDLLEFTEAIAELMEQEAEQIRRANTGGR